MAQASMTSLGDIVCARGYDSEVWTLICRGGGSKCFDDHTKALDPCAGQSSIILSKDAR